MITIHNLSKTFRLKSSSLVAVDQANLEIAAGEIFGIVGYSGAGKSTLLRMLNGLERPEHGSVIIGERDMTKIKGEELREARQKIGMIFQHFNLLWSRTVRENIAFPLEIAGVPKTQRKKRVDELIQLVGLNGKEDVYPSQLSGGQKQRVGIARALANQPEVLLCDEATSALDPETTDSILDLLKDINRRFGLTIVLITHEMHVIRKICHRVAVMDQGKIVEVGSVLDIFKNPKQQITKRFVNQMTESEETKDTIDHLFDKYRTGKIVKLSFVGESAERPIISGLIREIPVDVNILQGKIAQTQNGAYGTLYIQVTGKDGDIEAALEFLRDRQVGVEVIVHGRNIS